MVPAVHGSKSPCPQHALFLLCSLLVFVSSNTMIPSLAQPSNRSETDLQALLCFSSGIISDPTGVLSSWNSSLNFCSWHGVTCGRTLPPRVVSLSLSSMRLSGILPPCMANLSSLVQLELSRNKFSGSIPEELGALPGLQTLMLAGNSLSGNIPVSLGTASSLSNVSLANNSLSGVIPDSLASSSSLSVIILSRNNLSGLIPANLFNNSSKLVIVDLQWNDLYGVIPHFQKMAALQFLGLTGNRLSGNIPPSLGNATKLQKLDLSGNSLSGSVPSLGSLSNLNELILGNNKLEAEDWAFLTSLTNCTQLLRLSMDGNMLNGSLPKSVGNLVNLTLLGMDQNMLSGEIPLTVGNLSHLSVLKLSMNRLSGQIPYTIGNLPQLSQLYLDDNKLSGNIPANIGRCKRLSMLNLSVNNLDGSIPIELLGISSLSLGLDLSNNKLSGFIPEQVGALINLGLLNVSNNQLSGQIPYSLGQCVVLLSLNIEGNFINGSIPKSFSELKAIQQIDLSRNNLSGEVPEFFANFTSLDHLDLSHNKFEGPIPTGGIFRNSNSVILEGNTGLCASVSIFALPICPSTSPAKRKNARSLVTVLLIVIPTLTIAFLLLSWLLVTLWKNRVFSFPRCDLLCLNMFCFLAHPKRREVQTFPCHNEPLKKVSYGDILKATNWFSSVHTISSTRTGSVYVGRFKFDKSLVAIKVYNLNEPGAYGSYFIECEVLRNTRHRNLMRPVTLCSTLDTENHEFKALIFKFMVNGSLERWLHPEQYNGTPHRVLSLGQRMCIAADVASALDYVHNQLTPPLVHCDLKPSNILLDDDMTARLGDFGSAKFLFPDLISPQSLVDVGGTIGYMAPEYGMGRQISTGGDVYSFGVLLLEMLTGKRPTDDMFVDDLSLHKFVDSMFPERVAEILDPHMAHEEHQGCAAVWMHSYIIPLVALGLSCSMESPKDRPGMQDVCAKLSAIKEAFLESRD